MSQYACYVHVLKTDSFICECLNFKRILKAKEVLTPEGGRRIEGEKEEDNCIHSRFLEVQKRKQLECSIKTPGNHGISKLRELQHARPLFLAFLQNKTKQFITSRTDERGGAISCPPPFLMLFMRTFVICHEQIFCAPTLKKKYGSSSTTCILFAKSRARQTNAEHSLKLASHVQ